MIKKKKRKQVLSIVLRPVPHEVDPLQTNGTLKDSSEGIPMSVIRSIQFETLINDDTRSTYIPTSFFS